MKFWKKKDKSKTTSNPFEDDDYSQTTTLAEPVYEPPKPAYEPPKQPQRDVQQDRQSLFSGFMERKKPQTNAYEEEEEDDDQEVVQIKQKIRDVKQDSLASTRNALQKISEAEASGATTLNMLGTQSTQIANVERSLDLSKAYSDRASNQASELQKLNRSIFIPNISNPFTRSSRDREKMDKLNREHAEHIVERNGIRQSEFDSSARIEEAQRQVAMGKANKQHSNRSQSDRNRYQFEADEEDDAIEDEINDNLDLLSDATSRLKMMASTMNDELNTQNKRLNKLNKKVDPINEKLMATTHRLNSTR